MSMEMSTKKQRREKSEASDDNNFVIAEATSRITEITNRSMTKFLQLLKEHPESSTDRYVERILRKMEDTIKDTFDNMHEDMKEDLDIKRIRTENEHNSHTFDHIYEDMKEELVVKRRKARNERNSPICALPPELLTNIMTFFGGGNYAFVAPVSSTFRHCYKSLGDKDSSYLCTDPKGSASDSLHCSMLCFNQPKDEDVRDGFNNEMFKIAATKGKTKIVKFGLSNVEGIGRYMFNNFNVCIGAVRANHMDIITWIVEREMRRQSGWVGIIIDRLTQMIEEDEYTSQASRALAHIESVIDKADFGST